ncbi:MAG: glycerophosphodiester phosphodiesterase [bacterium]|nr:glycerophosphodiester phosphodiesterase [bacterium]
MKSQNYISPLKKTCPYLSHRHPIALAHRGSRVLWPENTMLAFQEAVKLGCLYIETDLHVTKDNVIVTFHDDLLQRLTNGSGCINEWSYEDLQNLDAAYYFNPKENFPLRNKNIKIPSLEMVMNTFPNVMFNLDLKQKGIEETVANFIDKHGFHDRVLIASFKDKRIRNFRKYIKEPVAFSTGITETFFIWIRSRVGIPIRTDASALQVPVRYGKLHIIDKKFIDAAHAAGVQVHAWTINVPEEMKKCLELGVDGIVTDRIDLF